MIGSILFKQAVENAVVEQKIVQYTFVLAACALFIPCFLSVRIDSWKSWLSNFF
jgi:hypothetical protein